MKEDERFISSHGSLTLDLKAVVFKQPVECRQFCESVGTVLLESRSAIQILT